MSDTDTPKSKEDVDAYIRKMAEDYRRAMDEQFQSILERSPASPRSVLDEIVRHYRSIEAGSPRPDAPTVVHIRAALRRDECVPQLLRILESRNERVSAKLVMELVEKRDVPSKYLELDWDALLPLLFVLRLLGREIPQRMTDIVRAASPQPRLSVARLDPLIRRMHYMQDPAARRIGAALRDCAKSGIDVSEAMRQWGVAYHDILQEN
jgi:hypothetical protein